MALLVEEQHLHQPLEHDVRVLGGVALVVDDLVLLELADGHVRDELEPVRLGQQVYGQDVAEGGRHPPELFELHARSLLDRVKRPGAPFSKVWDSVRANWSGILSVTRRGRVTDGGAQAGSGPGPGHRGETHDPRGRALARPL